MFHRETEYAAFLKTIEHKSIILQSSSRDQGLKAIFCHRSLGITQVWIPSIAQHCCATLRELMKYSSPSLYSQFLLLQFRLAVANHSLEADDPPSDIYSEGQ